MSNDAPADTARRKELAEILGTLLERQRAATAAAAGIAGQRGAIAALGAAIAIVDGLEQDGALAPFAASLVRERLRAARAGVEAQT